MQPCRHGKVDCPWCGGRRDLRWERVPLLDGAEAILRRLLDDALEEGPNRPDWRKLSSDAQAAVGAALDGRAWHAARLVAGLDEGGERWARLAATVRLVAGVALACHVAATGDAPLALAMLARLLERVRG